MPLQEYVDPLVPYKNAFHQLLAPKRLHDVDTRKQQIFFETNGQIFPIDQLSSGEREVVNIVFDFILRNPSDCIIFFDEPELHLHPELSYRLLQTLSSIGKSNQFIFCTHSPEIITASIENSVIFLRPKTDPGANQALIVKREDETSQALSLLGQSIGIISLGKKLLLIEGESSSLDKQTYGAILKNEFPELVLVPVGGKDRIRSFDDIQSSVLNQTIWGVEFFMLSDRDSAHDGTRADRLENDRFKMLPRYHLENYFLDESIIVEFFRDMESADSWLCDAAEVRNRLKLFCQQAVPLAVALATAAMARHRCGNVDLKVRGVSQNTTLSDLTESLSKRINSEKARIEASLDSNSILAFAESEYKRLMAAFDDDNDSWKVDVPGKVVLGRFAAAAGIDVGRLKTMYLKKASMRTPSPFEDIRMIFHAFRNLGPPV